MGLGCSCNRAKVKALENEDHSIVKPASTIENMEIPSLIARRKLEFSQAQKLSEDGKSFEEDEDPEAGIEFPFITEKSPPEQVAMIASEFTPVEGLELVIIGTAIPRRLSTLQKQRIEETTILDALRKEGLIPKPLSSSKNSAHIPVNGIGFELVNAIQTPYRSNAWTRNLELRREKFHKTISPEIIRENLDKAQERRKAVENEKLHRIVFSAMARNKRAVESGNVRRRSSARERWNLSINTLGYN